MSREKEMEPDSVLVKKAKEDPQAFGKIFDKYGQRIYNYIYQRTRNPNVAEDLTADVFERNLRRIDHWENRDHSYSAILYRSAEHAVINWQQRRRGREIPLHELVPRYEDSQDPVEERIAGSAQIPEEIAIRHEEREALLGALQKLPPDRQQLITLKLSQGMSNEEIGAIMGKTVGGVKSLYFRTLDELHQTLTGNPRPKGKKKW